MAVWYARDQRGYTLSLGHKPTFETFSAGDVCMTMDDDIVEQGTPIEGLGTLDIGEAVKLVRRKA